MSRTLELRSTREVVWPPTCCCCGDAVTSLETHTYYIERPMVDDSHEHDTEKLWFFRWQEGQGLAVWVVARFSGPSPRPWRGRGSVRLAPAGGAECQSRSGSPIAGHCAFVSRTRSSPSASAN